MDKFERIHKYVGLFLIGYTFYYMIVTILRTDITNELKALSTIVYIVGMAFIYLYFVKMWFYTEKKNKFA